jgi:FAD:protein FMN transferase
MRVPAHTASPHEAHGYSFVAMGTSCALQLFANSREHADMVAALAVAEIERIQEKYSRYAPTSILSAINRAAGEGKPVLVDEETAGLLEFAFACYGKSGGLFDITAGVLRRAWNFSSGQLPSDSELRVLLSLIGMDKLIWRSPHLNFSLSGMEMDFGGIGKEYAVDRVATLLVFEGIERGLINLGGDLFALGPQADDQPWKIGLRDPHHAGLIVEEVDLSHGALATSGDYERCLEIRGQRYCHILNPHTGWPVHGLSSVTVLAPQCMVAGSFATIAMLKEGNGIAWLAERGLPHRWIDSAGNQGGDLLP